MAHEEPQYPLHVAARDGKTSLVESLLATNPKDTLKKDDDERLPIHWAASNNHDQAVDLLMDVKNFDVDEQDGLGWTLLMIASSTGNEILLEKLLARGADVDMKNNNGQTALHFTASKSHLDIARVLITQKKASTRIRDKRSQLPLHRAAAVGSVPMVKLLLEHNSPVNTSDADGQTPLHHAVAEGNGDVAIVLLKAGAEYDKRDADGKLPIELAPDEKVIKYLKTACELEGLEMMP